MTLTFDWLGVLSGPPLLWLASGFVMTVCITLVASVLATLLAVALVGLRISPHRLVQAPARGVISIFRDSPLLIQLFFWYFAVYGLLPLGWRQWINDIHPWAELPGPVLLLTPEFIAGAWGLGLFSAVFIAEEIRAGLGAVPDGQTQAAQAQGFGPWQTLRFILLPQALTNAFQPVVGQYLNLMKLSSLATGIGLAEITYQVRQIESYNAHALEAFAAGTLLYLALGLVMGRVLLRFQPGRRRKDKVPYPAPLALQTERGSDGA